jgi:hypothetical protein
VNFSTACQEIIKRVASSATDDKETIRWTEIESDPVNRWVFPAGIVNEVILVYPIEDLIRNILLCDSSGIHGLLW